MQRRFLLFLASSVIVILIIFLQSESEKIEKMSLFRNIRLIVKTENAFIPKNIENIPDIYFVNRKRPSQYNKTCAKFPNLFDLKFTSDHWQTQTTTNGTLQLFSAHLDDREIDEKNWFVRIVGLFDRINPNQTFYCQFWMGTVQEPVVVTSEKFYLIWNTGWGVGSNGTYLPYLITCPLTKGKIPMSVSLVENPCDNPTNNLRISYKKVEEKERKNFVVCVKGLNFPFEDKSSRLIEWIELLLILGAEKVSFYQFEVHPRMKRVLDHYSESGKIEVVPITLVGGASNSPFLQNMYLKEKAIERRFQEVVPYNDCLYKHLQEYRYVVILDTDEIIIPSEGKWAGLVENLRKAYSNRTSYMARNVYFLDSYLHDHDWFEGIPTDMHMLQHVYRAKNYTAPGAYMKGFHDTRQVLALHNHYPIGCVKQCNSTNFDVIWAQLQHYRSDCVKDVKNCESMKADAVLDTQIWKYKSELIDAVNRTLTELN